MGRWVSSLGGPRRVSTPADPCQPHCTPAKPPNCRWTHLPGRADQARGSPGRLGRRPTAVGAHITTITTARTIYYLNHLESLGSRSSVRLLVGWVIARGAVLCNALSTRSSNTPHGPPKNKTADARCPTFRRHLATLVALQFTGAVPPAVQAALAKSGEFDDGVVLEIDHQIRVYAP
eukprot:COSAG01_NODE_1278_length_10930_cov_22.050226_1_plen_177_part_00